MLCLSSSSMNLPSEPSNTNTIYRLSERLHIISKDLDGHQQTSVYEEILSILDTRTTFSKFTERTKLAWLHSFKNFIKAGFLIKGITLDRLKNLVIICNLSNDSPLNQDRVAHEAIRCLANSLLLSQKLRVGFCKLDAMFVILQRLSNEQIDMLPDTRFLYYRLLFLATAEPSPALLELIDHHNVASMLSKTITMLNTTSLDSTKIDKNMMAIDIIKLIYNLLVNYPKSHYLFPIETSVSSTKNNKNSEPIQDSVDPDDFILERLERILGPLVNYMKSIPMNEADTLFFQCVQVLNHFNVERLTVPRLSPLDVCQVGRRVTKFITGIAKQGDYSGDHITNYEDASPYVILLMTLCRNFESLKIQTSSKLLPTSMDRIHLIGESNRPIARLVTTLTTTLYSEFKEALGELYFVLCDENVDRFIKKIGYDTVTKFLIKKNFDPVPIITPPHQRNSFDTKPDISNSINKDSKLDGTNIYQSASLPENPSHQSPDDDDLISIFGRVKRKENGIIRQTNDKGFHNVFHAFGRIFKPPPHHPHHHRHFIELDHSTTHPIDPLVNIIPTHSPLPKPLKATPILTRDGIITSTNKGRRGEREEV